MSSNSSEPVLIDGDFRLFSRSKALYYVQITSSGVGYCPSSIVDNHEAVCGTSAFKSLCLDDIIGCDCSQGKTADGVTARLVIISYPYRKAGIGKSRCRKRKTMPLTFKQHELFRDNYADAVRWKNILERLVRGESISPGIDTPSPERRLLVLVNPFSGPGKALHIFQQKVVPVFKESGYNYELKVTERAGHAREMVRTMDLDEWYGIVIVSGDGLIYEVVNGLMERSDWEKAIKKPIGAIPGGSGNALCCALSYYADEEYMENHILHSSFMIAKHRVVPMDLVAVDTCKGNRLYSFLMMGWGLISDVDIESEKYRSLGGSRFLLGALIRIVGLRKYRGRLSYLPAARNPNSGRSSSASKDCSTNDISGKDAMRKTSSEACLEHPQNFKHLPAANKKRSHKRAASESYSSSRGGITGLSATNKKSTSIDHSVDRHRGGGDRLSATPAGSDTCRPKNCSSLVPTPLLPPLDESVPSDWISVEDDFVLVTAVYQSHLAKDNVPAPKARLNDGVIHLIFMKSGVTRVKLLQMLVLLQEGKEVKDDSMEMIKVKAFRLEPLTTDGILTVDGEVVDYGPIQAQVLPSMARVMTLPDSSTKL